jgi:hypothetical protein
LGMAGVGMSNSMGLSDLASSLQTYSLEYNRTRNRIYFNHYQPHIILPTVLGHRLYAQLLHCFTTNTISCNLCCHHQITQNSSVWNCALPEEKTFTIQLPVLLRIFKLAEYITGMQNTQHQVTRLCMVMPNICVSPVQNLHHVTLLATRILRSLQSILGNFCTPDVRPEVTVLHWNYWASAHHTTGCHNTHKLLSDLFYQLFLYS